MRLTIEQMEELLRAVEKCAATPSLTPKHIEALGRFGDNLRALGGEWKVWDELLRLARRALVTEPVVEAALKWADSRIDDEDSTQRLVKVLHELKANELKADR